MIKTSTLLLGVILMASPALAQDANFKELNSLPYGVTSLTEKTENTDAAMKIFAKDASSISTEDIAAKVEDGGKLYTMESSAILVVEGYDPVLLTARSGGGYDASFICRVIPICTQNQK